VAATADGAVYTFGRVDGRIGHGDGDRERLECLPWRVDALDGLHVEAVAAGTFHALALTRCGRVYSWGRFGSDSVVCGLGSG
jgi:alpha-tubulin suppressor-like RCC1 family protein